MENKKPSASVFNSAWTSFILGVLAVIIAAAGFFWITQARQKHIVPALRQETSSAKVTAAPSAVLTETLPNLKPKIANKNVYVVQRGDSLWGIADKQYHDGFKWTEIARANNLQHLGILFAGMQLNIPESNKIIAQNNSSETLPALENQPKNKQIIQNTEKKTDQKISPTPTKLAQKNMNNKNNQATYTVQHGDNLWSIAVKEYNDGYEWVEIAKANNLVNPRVIHAGNVFIIPQNNS